MFDGVYAGANPATQNSTTSSDWSRADLDDLKLAGALVAPDIAGILDRFYAKQETIPALAAMISQAGGSARLKEAQKAHWSSLFNDDLTSKAFAERSLAIGQAHHRIGLTPKFYLDGYQFVCAELVQSVVKRERKEPKRTRHIDVLTRALFHDIALSLEAYLNLANNGIIKKEMMTVSDMLEREAINTIGEVGHKAAKFHQISKDVADRSTELRTVVGDLATATEAFADDLRTIAASAEELTALSNGIEQQVGQSANATSEIMELSHETRAAVETLNEATGQIASFVNLIRTIAAQTKMLSLNATIEAARAGEMGKGFAVVAQEVKGLANQTENSISEINQQTTAITDSSSDTSSNIERIDVAIGDMEGISTDIAEAVGQQLIATEDITKLMSGAAAKSKQVADSMQMISNQTEQNYESAIDLSEISEALSVDMERMRKRLLEIVNSSTVSEEHVRVPVAMETRFSDDNSVTDCMLVDLSQAGALLRFEDEATPARVPMGKLVTLNVEKLGTLPARCIMPADNTLHVQFARLTPEQLKILDEVVEQTHERDVHVGSLCRQAADEITNVFATSLKTGKITEAELFSEDYREIAETNPQQFNVAYAKYTDINLTSIQDRVQASEEGIIFCCSIDRNAFIATHNSQYSKPPRKDDPVWNTANCRNRKFFTDKAGMLAAHNRQDVFTQTYARDMGGGVFVYLKEVDCPITVNGRIWGNLRLGYKM